MIGKMETGSALLSLGKAMNFDIINSALNLTAGESTNKNNCFSMAIETTEGKPISKNGMHMYLNNLFTAIGADTKLSMNFNSTESLTSGNTIIRYSTGDSNNDGLVNSNDMSGGSIGGASHYAVFMLKNANGTQVFTKNGLEAGQYEVMYTNQAANSLNGSTIESTYGNPTPLSKDKVPYYKSK